jgi:hypothetical protein
MVFTQMKLTCIHIPPSTPEFRKAIARKATRFITQLSSCGRYQDIMAVRGKDNVYITTLTFTL